MPNSKTNGKESKPKVDGELFLEHISEQMQAFSASRGNNIVFTIVVGDARKTKGNTQYYTNVHLFDSGAVARNLRKVADLIDNGN